MNNILKTKAAGSYLVVLAGIISIVSIVRYLMWAPKHESMDAVIVAALIAGLIVDIVIIIRDNEYLMVVGTACYSVALVKLLTDSVGSFVDAFQGIQMFGDATQVSTIVSISEIMAVSVVLSIIASFLKRIKE